MEEVVVVGKSCRVDSFYIPNVCATRDHEIGWDGLEGSGCLVG